MCVRIARADEWREVGCVNHDSIDGNRADRDIRSNHVDEIVDEFLPTITEEETFKADILVKQIDTYLTRSHESTNNITHSTNKKIELVFKKRDKSRALLNRIQYVVYFLTFTIGIIFIIIIFKKTGQLLKDRNLHLEKIKQHHNTIQKIFDSLPVGILVIDQNYIVQRTNNTALNLFGAKNKKEIVQNKCFSCFKTEIEDTCPIKDNKPIHDLEIDLITTEGTKFPVLKNVVPIQINGDNLILEAFIDISHQKKIEKQLQSAKEDAEESNRLKSSFLANMSHEIRTPMNGILGFAQLLQNHDLTSAELEKYSGIILKSGNHLLNIINDIIDMSKIESGELSIKKSAINLNTLFKNLYEFFIHSIENDKDKNIKLKTNFALKDEDSIIISDGTRLNQIATNLINNAIKFTNTGFVEFGYTIEEKAHEDSLLRIYVKDTGIGIEKHEQKIVFERFRQSKHNINKSYGGTGLGLSISKACIQKLGGELQLESEKGKGSTFYFTIPFKKNFASKKK